MKYFNRKGVMLEFLVGVLLALLIFTPTCYFTAKVFRLSQQSEDNFREFVVSLKELQAAAKEEDNIRIQVLALDQETAFAYFEPGKEEVVVEVIPASFGAKAFGNTLTLEIQRPSSCVMENNCFCLLQKYTFVEDRVSVSGEVKDIVRVIPDQVKCESKLPFHLLLSNCGLGVAHDVQEYTCSGGFVIERLLVKKARSSSLESSGYYELPRRFSLNLIKTSDSITLTTELPKLSEKKQEEK